MADPKRSFSFQLMDYPLGPEMVLTSWDLSLCSSDLRTRPVQ